MPEDTELETSTEAPAPASPAERLGFAETAELHALRAEAVQVIQLGNPEQVRDVMTRYRAVAEALVDQQPDARRPYAQIGLIVAVGEIHRDAGNQARYAEELTDADMYAQGMGYEDLAALLADIDELFDRLEAIPAAETLSPESFTAEIKAAMADDELDEAEALGFAYTLLEEHGIDPDSETGQRYLASLELD